MVFKSPPPKQLESYEEQTADWGWAIVLLAQECPLTRHLLPYLCNYPVEELLPDTVCRCPVYVVVFYKVALSLGSRLALWSPSSFLKLSMEWGRENV